MIKEGDPVEFIAFNFSQQIAMDKENRIWQVDGWYDKDGDEIMNRFYNPDDPPHTQGNVNMEEWEHVAYVTLRCKIDGRTVWSQLFPDDFDESKNN